MVKDRDEDSDKLSNIHKTMEVTAGTPA